MRFYFLTHPGSVLMLRPAFAAFCLSSLRLLGSFAVPLIAGLRRRPSGFSKTQAVLSVSLLAMGVALTGCSPTYDWRTVMNNDNGYTVELPAKPSVDARQIEVGGTSMRMAMQIAEAGQAVFAVGTLMLPSDDPQMQRTALDFLRDGLARNVSAAPAAHAVQIPLAAGGQVP